MGQLSYSANSGGVGFAVNESGFFSCKYAGMSDAEFLHEDVVGAVGRRIYIGVRAEQGATVFYEGVDDVAFVIGVGKERGTFEE